MSENYICINGKKAELTEEQLKQLGIEVPKANPFARVNRNERYYAIMGDGTIFRALEENEKYDNDAFNIANYCTDKSLMEQRALHETLSRLLWRYSMEHDGDKIKTDNGAVIYGIYQKSIEEWSTYSITGKLFGSPMFYTRKIAYDAIEEIIKPFMAANPEFKW